MKRTSKMKGRLNEVKHLEQSQAQQDVAEGLEKLLTQQDVADTLNVSVRHVAKMSAADMMPRPINLGRSVRYRPDEIRKFLRGEWKPESANKV